MRSPKTLGKDLVYFLPQGQTQITWEGLTRFFQPRNALFQHRGRSLPANKTGGRRAAPPRAAATCRRAPTGVIPGDGVHKTRADREPRSLFPRKPHFFPCASLHPHRWQQPEQPHALPAAQHRSPGGAGKPQGTSCGDGGAGTPPGTPRDTPGTPPGATPAPRRAAPAGRYLAGSARASDWSIPRAERPMRRRGRPAVAKRQRGHGVGRGGGRGCAAAVPAPVAAH